MTILIFLVTIIIISLGEMALAENMKKYSEKTVLRTFQKKVPDEDRTFAQALYRKLKDITFSNPENEKKLASVDTERERVKLMADLVRQTADKYFSSIGNDGLSDVFFQELENQRKSKQEQIRQEAINNNTILWHATPLSKDELDGGVLKGTTERPDLVWEKTFTGVCAFPHSNGAYAIKKAKDEQDFACKGENLVRLTDNRLDGKKDNDVLGFIHGHKLRPDDGFVPTVALDGSVPGEWITEKEVVIDETKEVSLHSLRENGVHIFAIDKKDNDLVKNLMAGKTIDEQIRLFEEMAAHPDKTYAAENGNLQKIKVKDYYNKKQTSLDTKALFSIKSEKNFSA